MLDAKMTAPHIKLCIVFGSNVRRKKGGSTYLNDGSNGRRKTDGSEKRRIHILNYVSSSALML